LPYTHIYARTIDHYGCLVSGSVLCLAASAETLIDDLAEIRPTNFASVPRFYEKVLSAETAGDPSATAKRLRRVFGDRLDWMSSGGAPLPTAIARAYLDAGLPLLQGYGLTETSPVISFNTKQHHRLGSVGLALPGVEVRIADDGEILTRGPHVMKGYWQDAAATAAAIQDGWFHTGDLGYLDADGYLFINGRKKELLVLSNGKKVVPSYLEGLLLADPCFDQVVICGEGRNFLTALIVPHWANVAQALGWDDSTRSTPAEERAQRADLIELLEQRVRHGLREVSPAEQVRKIAVIPQPFTVGADELTVSLKLRRTVVLRNHAPRLAALYQE
jgi:long-chain acyl-CoA synthetase